MLHTNLGNAVPTRFRNVSSIPSVELRNDITGIISSLYGLMSETQDFEPDPDTKELVDRYFDYLTQSAQSPAKIVKRAYWLSFYGHEVVRRLMIFRNKKIKFSAENICTEHDDLMGSISNLVEVISNYHTNNPAALAKDANLIMEYLDAIVTATTEIKPNQRSHYYSNVGNAVQFITRHVEHLARDNGGVFAAGSSEQLARSLWNLLHKIQHYQPRRASMN